MGVIGKVIQVCSQFPAGRIILVTKIEVNGPVLPGRFFSAGSSYN